MAIHPIMSLADLVPPGGAQVSTWAPVVWILVIAIGFAGANLALSILVGPARTGAAKETTYESGMVPVGDARRRFNVRFYIVAMIFLVFDVDIIFFYPWATIFAPAVRASAQGATGSSAGPVILVEMVVFIAVLLVAYLYAWGKGVFRWD
jgi:NADH:ubiquinone oxidoreductase subunit 3 (subunit A)